MRRLFMLALLGTACRSTPEPAPLDDPWQVSRPDPRFGVVIHRQGAARLLHRPGNLEVCAWVGYWPTSLDATPRLSLPPSLRRPTPSVATRWELRRGSGLLVLEASSAELRSALEQLEAADWPPPRVAVLEGCGLEEELPLHPAMASVATSSLSRGRAVWRRSLDDSQALRSLEVLAQLVAAKAKAQLDEQDALQVSTALGENRAELRLQLTSTSTDADRARTLGRRVLAQLARGEMSVAEFEAARARVRGSLRRRLGRSGPRALLWAETIMLDDALLAADATLIEAIDVASVRDWAKTWSEAAR